MVLVTARISFDLLLFGFYMNSHVEKRKLIENFSYRYFLTPARVEIGFRVFMLYSSIFASTNLTFKWTYSKLVV